MGAESLRWVAAVLGGAALAGGLHLAQGPAATDLQTQLAQQLERHPDDGRALVLRARLDAQAQRWDAATAGYGKAVAVSAKVARDPAVWVEYAEARGMLQHGSLLGEPQVLVRKALALDPSHHAALDLAGSAHWEQGDYAQAAVYWERLQRLVSPADPRHEQLSLAIRDARRRAKLALR